MVSLHDMYLKEPIISMLDEKVDSNLEYPIDPTIWHNECADLLKQAKYVIAPSMFIKKSYESIYDCKIDVIGHGVDVEKAVASNQLSSEKNIAFVGAIFPHKGSELLESLTKQVKSNDKIRIHLFGTTTAQITNSKIFFNHGPYKRERLASLLKKNKIDLVCAFSLAPESFAYTVEEVIASGVPVLTFNIGAAKDRVKDNNLGWVMKYTDNPRVIINKIKEILGDMAKYQKVIDSINNYRIKSVNDMALEYDQLYDNNAKIIELKHDTLRSNLEKTVLIENIITQLSGKSYSDDYFAIINSRKWRLVSKIKIPKSGKKVVKKILKRNKK